MAWDDSLTKEQIKKWEYLWDEYVPDEGPAESLGGEIMRAMAKIVHSWSNNGDMAVKYGYHSAKYNYAAAADWFLYSCEIPRLIKLTAVFDEKKYGVAVDKNLKTVYNYVVKHPELFEEPNVVDVIKLAEKSYKEFTEAGDDDYEENVNRFWGYIDSI